MTTAMKWCTHCGNVHGHATNLDDVQCSYRAATTAAIKERATSLNVDPVAAVDLLAHLRGKLGEPTAYSTACYVLDLGWRPLVGQNAKKATP